MIDRKRRNIAKAITWKVLGLIVISSLTYVITGSMKEVGLMALGYHGIMLGAYVGHERFWDMIKWGKTNGLFIQMTGLSGAGKTTIARAVAEKLRGKGFLVEVIDGDEYREGLCKDLGFSKEDRNTNIRRLGFVGKVLARNNVIVLMSAINPYQEVRKEITDMGAKTVFVDCDIDTVIERDTKGLYKKALSGEIPNFTGISDPFEVPTEPDLVLLTNAETVEESAEKFENFILENV